MYHVENILQIKLGYWNTGLSEEAIFLSNLLINNSNINKFTTKLILNSHNKCI